MAGEVVKAAGELAWPRDTLVTLLHLLVRRAGGKVEVTGRELDDAVSDECFNVLMVRSCSAADAFRVPVVATLTIERKVDQDGICDRCKGPLPAHPLDTIWCVKCSDEF